MGEIWKDVVGWEGLYRVSNLGRVRSVRRVCSGTKLAAPGKTGRLLVLGVRKDSGYQTVVLYRGKEFKGRYVHHLVLEAFVGLRPPGAEARHFPDKDGSNNQARNLRWGTPKENAADKKIHGTVARGERNGHAKVTEKQVREIRRRYAVGDISMKALGKEYGLALTSVYLLINRMNWAHVK